MAVCAKGKLEDEIPKAIQWGKDYMGRGSTEAKTDILCNMIIAVLKGVLFS